MPEQTSTNPRITSWLNHIRAFALDIGPRGRHKFIQGIMRGRFGAGGMDRRSHKTNIETNIVCYAILSPPILTRIGQ